MDDDGANRAAAVGSALSGALCAVGWFIFLDGLLRANTDCVVWGTAWNPANCTTPSSLIAPDGLVSGAYWAPGIIGTFGLVGLNLISWEAVTEEGFDSGIAAKARVWVIFSMICMCCALGGGIWIMVAALNEEGKYTWAAVATFIQNLLIVRPTIPAPRTPRARSRARRSAAAPQQTARQPAAPRTQFVAGILFRVCRRSGDNAM